MQRCHSLLRIDRFFLFFPRPGFAASHTTYMHDRNEQDEKKKEEKLSVLDVH
jgi:hypothetical protein